MKYHRGINQCHIASDKIIEVRSNGRKVRSNGMKVRSNGMEVRSNERKVRSNGMQVAIRLHFCPECPSIGFSHEYDEWHDYDNKRNYFPFARLEKMFFPEEGSLEDRGNIFHGQLYRRLIPSISPQLCVQEQILWSLLRPLKWYKLKSCGNK